MRYSISLLTLLILGILMEPVSASHKRSEIVVKEEWISPELKNFDCHGTSILEVEPGVLCAVWKGGPGKGKSNFEIKENVGIWLSDYQNGEWSAPVELVKSGPTVTWTPILSKHPSGELMLFYRLGDSPWQSISLLKRSVDGGKTWSAAEILPAGIVGPTRTSPLFNEQGMMICGSSTESGSFDDELKATACWIETSLDAGKSWTKYGPFEMKDHRFGVIEPVLFHDAQGNMKMFCRDRAHKVGGKGWIQSAMSTDGGKTWSDFEKTCLPNPDSAFDVVDFGSGKLLLVFNNSHTNRYPLSLAFSEDGGDSWTGGMILEEASGEFPSASLDSSGLVHIAYSSIPPGGSQRRIKHMVIDPTVILGQ